MSLSSDASKLIVRCHFGRSRGICSELYDHINFDERLGDTAAKYLWEFQSDTITLSPNIMDLNLHTSFCPLDDMLNYRRTAICKGSRDKLLLQKVMT